MMPHSDHLASSDTEAISGLPAFPSTVPTAPLLRISLQKLLKGDPAEEERCWKACCDLGFFYLDLRTGLPLKGQHGEPRVGMNGEALLRDADRLFEVMKRFFELDVEEKVKYDFADQDIYYGYKGLGVGIIDEAGTRDKNEFYNISKNDILSLTHPLPSPSALNKHRSLFASYIQSSHALCSLVLTLLSRRLPLTSARDLRSLHRLNAISGDQIRFVRAPPQKIDTSPGVSLGEHTDFGSVTVLFNKLGGLQVRLPNGIDAIPGDPFSGDSTQTEKDLTQDGWAYVRPLPGHAIINLGDALSIFSGGKLRSNIHRVVPPPGEQAVVERYSLVYFSRPEDDVVLKKLVKEDGRRDSVGEGNGEEVTAKEWILRRALGRRRAAGWETSGGTEEISMRGKKT